jgi:outer membrane protein
VKKFLLAMCASSLIATQAVAEKIAILDLEAALKQSKVFTDARAQIEKVHGAAQKDMEKMAQDLKTLAEKIKSSEGVVTKAELADMKKKFEEDQKAFANKQIAFQNELVKDQQKAFGDAIAAIQKEVKSYAIKNKYDIVLVKNEVVYASDSVNITDAIAKALQ